MKSFSIGRKAVGASHPTFFIADIAANHDGDLARAKELIKRAAAAGADAAKFQHFTAATIVSDHGFRSLKSGLSHQAAWTKSVFEVYDDASLNVDWTGVLKETCDQAGIEFMTSPYSLALVDQVAGWVPAFKVGSGDITWHSIIEHMAAKGKPVLLATGAATLDDVTAAMDVLLRVTPEVGLMQCNTNYTASLENFKFINLNVLKTYAAMYPEVVLGLSDHTPGHATVLGAIALGARLVEKHFTDDTSRVGPDHKFSMDPQTWRDMVDRSRELEAALGSGIQRVEGNERDTVVVQRRAIRAARNLNSGEVLTEDALEVLRPCPADGISPNRIAEVLGRQLTQPLVAGEHVRWQMLK